MGNHLMSSGSRRVGGRIGASCPSSSTTTGLWTSLHWTGRRALAAKQIEDDGEHGLQITDAGVVRGLIECDAAGDASLPLLVIDGREISWENFGRSLMTFEGFQFKLELRDRSEEV